jgi:hypothetical protein
MLYCYKTAMPSARLGRWLWSVMPTPVPHHHHHHHHHPDGGSHPAAALAPSILRMALMERLVAVAVIIAVIWGTVLWAMT